jgi:hypothetical protein
MVNSAIAKRIDDKSSTLARLNFLNELSAVVELIAIPYL